MPLPSLLTSSKTSGRIIRFYIDEDDISIDIAHILMSIQAGLEDFGYMENMTSVAELKEEITITGAEVSEITFTFHEI